MDISTAQQPDTLIVTLRGVLDIASAPQVRSALGKAFRDARPVLVDLTAADLGGAAAVAVFPRAADEAGGWPAARLVLIGPNRRMMRALRASRTSGRVPTVADLPAARAIAEDRPEIVQSRRRLAAGLDSPRLARAQVRDVCTAWSIAAQDRELAVVIASELVSNAVEHAGSDSVLMLRHDRRWLAVSVRDGSDRVPQRRSGVSLTTRLHGLDVVSSLAVSWGVAPLPDGKTVWARLATANPSW